MQTSKNVHSSVSNKCAYDKYGLQHQKNDICKAKSQKCHKCLKYNHFARQCLKTCNVSTIEITKAPSEKEFGDDSYVETV